MTKNRVNGMKNMWLMITIQYDQLLDMIDGSLLVMNDDAKIPLMF